MKLFTCFWMVTLVSLGLGGTSFGLPILSEVFYDAVGSDASHVFTEIVGAPGHRLDGWRLVGVNGGNGSAYRSVDLTGAVIPDDGILVIATVAATGALRDVVDFTADVDWQNGPDAVELWTPGGVRADALQYGDTGGAPLGNGAPAPDPAPGFSLARWDLAVDTGNNAVDFVVSEPTPGTVPGPEPTADVSEPAGAGLVAFLLAFLSLRPSGIACFRTARHSGRLSRCGSRPVSTRSKGRSRPSEAAPNA